MTASIRDVARRAQVSVGTVSNVLNTPEKVSPETRERVQTVIAQLGYVRNDAARQLRNGQSHTIGLIVLNGTNPFFTEIAQGAQNRALESGYTVLVGTSNENVKRENTLLSLFAEQQVAGILVSPTGDDLSPLCHLKDGKTPVVLVDRGAANCAFSAVACDDIYGGEVAAEHLLETGKRKIAYVGGPITLKQISDRWQGAAKAVLKVPDATLRMIETTALTVTEGKRIGQEIAKLPVEKRPDAVFAANDLIALGMLQSLVLAKDIRIPEDIAIIGYDDISYAEFAIVPLTTVRQPAEKIGAASVELLLNAIERPRDKTRQITLKPELVVRAST